MQLNQLKAEAIKLSPQERIELVSEIVKSWQNESASQGDRSAAIERMRGLLATDKPAPTDEEVALLLEERLREKYIQSEFWLTPISSSIFCCKESLLFRMRSFYLQPSVRDRLSVI